MAVSRAGDKTPHSVGARWSWKFPVCLDTSMRPCMYVSVVCARSEVLTAFLMNIQVVWFVKAELVCLLYCTVGT